MMDKALFTIRPNAGGGLVAVILTWLMCCGVAAMASEPGQSFWVGWTPVLPFALMISYYGYFKPFLQGAGKIAIGRNGFSIKRGDTGTKYHEWRSVDLFFVGGLGASPLSPGAPVPLFRLKGSSNEYGLPGNTDMAVKELVELMNHFLESANTGWAKVPATLEEVIRDAKAQPIRMEQQA